MEYDKDKDKEKFMKHVQIIGLIFIPPMIYALLDNLPDNVGECPLLKEAIFDS